MAHGLAHGPWPRFCLHPNQSSAVISLCWWLVLNELFGFMETLGGSVISKHISHRCLGLCNKKVHVHILWQINICPQSKTNLTVVMFHNWGGGGGGELDPCLGIWVPLGVWNPDPVLPCVGQRPIQDKGNRSFIIICSSCHQDVQ